MKPQLLFVTDHLPFPADLDGSTVINGNLLPWLSETFSIHYCCLENAHANKGAIEETQRYVESLHIARPDNPSGPILGLRKLGRFLLGQPHETEPVASRELRQTVIGLQRDNRIAAAWIDLHYHAPLIDCLEVPAIISPHDARPLLYETFAASRANRLAGLYYRLHARVLRRYEQRYFSRFDRILYVSGKDADYAATYLPATSIMAIPNGFDTRRMKAPTAIADPSSPRLVFSGNLDYKPNRDAAAFLCRDFMPAFLDSFPRARLTIVGNVDERWQEVYQSEATEFTGHVPDVVEELSRHDLYLCPLTSGAGFKNKILDAIAAGLPVIGTPISFDGMVFNQGKDVLICGTASLRQEVARLLESDTSRQMAAHAQDTLREHYSWESIAKRYIDTVHEVLGKS
ncbi:MAG: glycosyltransferase [Pseudomonadales bacterium]|nr:glycosyltransferase [Pseudomonadales bacterium]